MATKRKTVTVVDGKRAATAKSAKGLVRQLQKAKTFSACGEVQRDGKPRFYNPMGKRHGKHGDPI